MKCLHHLSLKWIVSNLAVFERLFRSILVARWRICFGGVLMCVCMCGNLSAGWMWQCNCYSEGQQVTASTHVGTTLHVLHWMRYFIACRKWYIKFISVLLTNYSSQPVKRYPQNKPRRTRWGVKTYVYSSFNLSARWGGWSTPRPGRFTLGNDPVPII